MPQWKWLFLHSWSYILLSSPEVVSVAGKIWSFKSTCIGVWSLLIQYSPDSSPQICIIHKRLLLKKRMVGIVDCSQVPVHTPWPKALIRLTLLQFWTCRAFLEERTKEAENIVFHHHTFPPEILQAKGIVPQTSHILKRVVSSSLFHFIWCCITHHRFPLVAVISPNFQLFRKLLISLGDMRDFSSNAVFFLLKGWKVNNCSKLYSLILWRLMLIFILNVAFPKHERCFESLVFYSPVWLRNSC